MQVGINTIMSLIKIKQNKLTSYMTEEARSVEKLILFNKWFWDSVSCNKLSWIHTFKIHAQKSNSKHVKPKSIYKNFKTFL